MATLLFKQHLETQLTFDPLSKLNKLVKTIINDCSSMQNYNEINQKRFLNLIYALQEVIETCVKNQIRDEVIFNYLTPLQEIFSSTLSKRMRHWPRGYPGDYETIESIYYKINHHEPDSIQWLAENYFYSLPVTQQHRNKINYQATLIQNTVKNNPFAKILILACGGAIDLSLCMSTVRHSNATIYINDMDEAAIHHSLQRCQSIQNKIIPLTMNILSALRKVPFKDKFDLIVAGGIFDYLNDQIASLVIRHAYNLLAPRKVFSFTNTATDNPSKYGLEYIFNWKLIHRSEQDIKKLCALTHHSGNSLKITRDKTGLSLLIELMKNKSYKISR